MNYVIFKEMKYSILEPFGTRIVFLELHSIGIFVIVKVSNIEILF